MNVRMIDAISFFEKGGFIDLQTGQYILPKNFKERMDRLRLGIDSSSAKQIALQNALGTILELSEYEAIEKDDGRYITAPPVIRPSGVHCAAAEKLGLSRDHLIAFGFRQNDCWNFFYPCKVDENLSGNIIAPEDEDASAHLDEYMRQHGLYPAYIKMCIAIRHDIMRDWLLKHGVEVCEQD